MTTESPELQKQNAKFGYKAPETVYHKHDPKASLAGSGRAFTGVSPMDFYMRKNAEDKERKAKAAETKVGTYKHNMYKGGL
jgi:hypothetical protein